MPVSAVPTCLEQAGIVELLDQQIPQSLCVCRNGFEQQVEAGDMSFGSQVAEQSHDRLWVAARDFRESGAHDVEKIARSHTGPVPAPRTEGRRVGKERDSTCRSWWSPSHLQKKYIKVRRKRGSRG